MLPLLTWMLSASAAPSDIGIALRQGNCGKAAEYNPNDNEWNYQLAIGKCLLSLGQVDRATDMLSKVEAPWRGYALMYQAEGASLLQQHDQAILLSQSIIRTPDIPKELNESASLILAKSYIANGEYIEARNLLRPLLTPDRSKDGYIPPAGSIDPAEVRWWLAEGARLRGSSSAAIPVYWRIWMSNPTSVHAQFAEERLIELGERIPNSTTEAGRDQIVRRAKTLRKLQPS